MSEMPKNFIDEFLDLKRRVSTLERATRVPTVSSTASGPRGATNISTVNVLSGITESYTAFDGAVSVTAVVPQTGRVTIFLADDAFCESSSGSDGWYAAPALTGANVVAASDSYALRHFADGTRRSIYFAQMSNLTPGETTFTLQRRHTGVAPTVSAGFRMQTLLVQPF
jgi:hypothetical protein